jgi:hypothetical protein
MKRLAVDLWGVNLPDQSSHLLGTKFMVVYHMYDLGNRVPVGSLRIPLEKRQKWRKKTP